MCVYVYSVYIYIYIGHRHIAAGNGLVQGQCYMKTWFSHSGKRASPVDITGDVLWRDFVEMDIDEYSYGSRYTCYIRIYDVDMQIERYMKD